MVFCARSLARLPGFFMERHMGTKKKGGKKY